MRRRISVVAAAALLLSMTMTSSASAHHPPPVSGEPEVDNRAACDQAVTANLTLSHDIGPCPGDGLVVAADNITINLNGWDIIGDGRATEEPPPAAVPAASIPLPVGDAGIRLTGRTGVKVTNEPVPSPGLPAPEADEGEVREFNSGVFINGGSGNTVENLHLHDNRVLGSDGTNVSDLGDGIQIRNSSNNVIRANHIHNNEGYGGIYVVGNSDNNKIGNDGVAGNGTDANTVNDNDQQFSEVFARQTSGIRVQFLGTACPNGNVIDGNTVNANGNDGIQLFACANGNDIMNNETNNNGRDGIHLFPRANDNDVYDNEASNNGVHTEGDGINVGGSFNDVTSNVTSDNHRDGVSLGFCRRNLPHDDFVCPPGLNGSNSATSNVIASNTATGNGTPADPNAPTSTVTSTCTTLEPAPGQVDNICDTFDEGVAHGSGIHAQLNATTNTISGNVSNSNVVWDMLDDWDDCVHNTWTMNTFGTEKPTCIN